MMLNLQLMATSEVADDVESTVDGASEVADDVESTIDG